MSALVEDSDQPAKSVGLSAEDRLIANLQERRSKCRNNRRMRYMGAVALIGAALVLSYLGPSKRVHLILPLGPFLLAVALSRIVWGLRVARFAAAIVVVIAVGELAPLIMRGELALWAYCLIGSLAGFVIAGHDA